MIWVKFTFHLDNNWWKWREITNRKPKKFKNEEDIFKFIHHYNCKWNLKWSSERRGMITDFNIIKVL